jgi:DNA-binding NarL/FixJ family response regulator
MTIKLLVACRKKDVALALCAQIVHAADGRITGEATDLDGVIHAAAAAPPDVLLLQYTHSRDETTRNAAWQVLAHITGVSGATRILLVCNTYTPHSVVGFIRHGASGCVLLSSQPSVYAKAVLAVHQGETWFGRTELMEALRIQMRANSFITPHLQEEQELLTAREREILSLIGKDLSNKEIAQQLNISAHTVKNHLHNIYVKLEKSGRYKAFLSKAVAAPPLGKPPGAARRPRGRLDK